MGICNLVALGTFLDLRADEPKPKDFFKHNYAVAPGYEGAGKITEGPGTQGSSSSKDSAVQAPQIEQASSLPKLKLEAKKPTVYVFVNSLERAHFNRVVQEAIRLHDAKRAIVVGMFHIGDYEAVTPSIEQELSSREIGLYQVDSVFRELFAESSPTWVVSTPQGRHVAEGFLEIAPFFDEWGEFNPKRSAEPEVSSTMEGF